jgi:hypothetical protein
MDETPNEVILKKGEGSPTLTVHFGNDILKYEFVLYLFPDDSRFKKIAEIDLDSGDQGESKHQFPINFEKLDKDQLKWVFRVAVHPTSDAKRWVRFTLKQNGKQVFKKNYKKDDLENFIAYTDKLVFKEI